MRTFLLLLLLATPLAVFAVDGSVSKDPVVQAAEARKLAEQLRKEALSYQQASLHSGKKLTKDEKKYLELTVDEAEASEKMAEALDKNQKRMAEKYQANAGKLCTKRGELASKIGIWDKKPEEAKDTEKDHSAKISEIEKQQAELEKMKQALQQQSEGKK